MTAEQHAARTERFRRFMSKVHASAPGGCWQWDRTKPYAPQFIGWEGQDVGVGYGSFHGRPAHRVSYEFFWGPIPEGHAVHHQCGNGGCVNPAHLEALPKGEHVGMHQRIAHDVKREELRTGPIEHWTMAMLLEAEKGKP